MWPRDSFMASQLPSDMSSHQTVRLGPGRHAGRGAVVCVMELSSMLAGERFTDRPASVCPIVAALLRAYNDNVDQRRRNELYGYAAEAVGTRGDFDLQRRRARSALTWAQRRYAQRRRLLWPMPHPPRPDDGPDLIARYVLRSLGRRSDESHRAVLELLDQLIEMEAKQPATDPARPPRVGCRDWRDVRERTAISVCAAKSPYRINSATITAAFAAPSGATGR